MVLIVQADTDDSSDIRNGWSDAHMVIYERQLIYIDRSDLFELLVGERGIARAALPRSSRGSMLCATIQLAVAFF